MLGCIIDVDYLCLNKKKLVMADKKTTKTPAPKTKKKPELSTYVHPEKRLNNPPVGLVNSHSDGVEEKQRWAYDPHIDPALQFDTGRAQIEQLIDEALASDDPEQYRGALEELKRLAQPYLRDCRKTLIK